MIICGGSAIPRLIDFAAFREIADEVGAILMVDAAHFIGLVAGGAIPSPVPHADVVTFTTHKVLRGPRGGMILAKAEHAAAIDKAVFPMMQGGPLMHAVAAKAVALKEAASPEYAQYARDVIANSQALTAGLAAQGMRPVTGGTDTHLALLDLQGIDVTGTRGRGPLRRGGHRAEQEHHPQRPAPGQRRLGHPRRHALGDDPGDGRGADGHDRRADRDGRPRRGRLRRPRGPSRCHRAGHRLPGVPTRLVREYGLSLLVAAALTFLVMPVVRSLALRAGAVAGVRDRDVHDHAIPRWGGLGMFLGLCAGMLLASKLPMMRSVFEGSSTEGVALLSGAVIIVALGLADDRWELDAPTKMAGQVLAAAVMALQGITLLWLPIDGVLVLDPTTSVLLTVLIVLVSVNAINFIDGLDGLAAGITAVSAAAFFIYAYLLSVQFGVERATLSALVSALLVGVCIGFLPHNVFPARLFMGDTGSMLIGYLMAASVITLTGKVDPNALEGTTLLPALLPILVPLAVLAVPLLDLGLAVIRRTRAGRSPFAPDKQHLHHRLLEMGHSQRRAVLLLTGWAALIAFTVVLLAFVPLTQALAASAVGVLLLGLGVAWPGMRRRGARPRSEVA